MIVDKATDMKWSYFIKHKDDQCNILINFIKNKRKDYPKIGTYIQCNNAGENKTFKKRAEKEGLGIKFKYTSRETPQQNGKVERRFATVYGRAQAMMLTAGLDNDKKYELWTEAVSTATLLANKTVTKKSEQSLQERFYKNVKE